MLSGHSYSARNGAQRAAANVDPIEIKTQLQECLEEIRGQCVGSFAHGEALPDVSNPGLFIRGLGPINLPLSERQVPQLRKACHRAPFGKGSETLVDTTVRDTWELNPDQFVLQKHFVWQTTLDRIVERVAKALGVPDSSSVGNPGVKAELYKLLLYDEGAFFDSHTDTEKVPGMIGTLVIALPSKHTGENGYSYVAWYSDVEHAVRPVISGHRLVLTYNLIQTVDGPRQSASSLNEGQVAMAQPLALWNDQISWGSESAPKFLAYMLDHKYTDANLRSDHLKGKDAQQFRHLEAACQDQNITLFLANVEHSKEGSCEETYDPYDHYGGRRGYNWKDDDDEDDDDDDDGSIASDEGSGFGSEICDYHDLAEAYDISYKLRTFSRANGQLLALDVDIERDDIVQDDYFDRAPDKEEYEGYTGNAGASATHFYRNSCIILMPKQQMVPFLLEHAKYGVVNIDDWLAPIIEEVKNHPGDRDRRAELTSTCHSILAAFKAKSTEERPRFYNRTTNSMTDETLGVVAKAALQLRNQTVFDQASRAAKNCLPSQIYSTFGETLREDELSKWNPSLLLAVSRISKVHLRWQAVTKTLKARPSDPQDASWRVSDADALGKLLRRSIEDILSLEATTCKADAEAIIEMIQAYDQGFVFRNVLPFVKKHVSDTGFTITFLTLLFKAENACTVKAGISRNIFRDVLADLLPSFKIKSDQRSQKRPKYSYSYTGLLPEPQDIDFIEALGVADLLDACKTMELAEERESLIAQLLLASRSVDPSGFGKFFIPLLIRMIQLSHAHNVPTLDTIPRSFFKNIINTYVLQFVGLEPEPPCDWARARTGCRHACKDCSTLNQFLLSPREKVGKFSIAEKRRRHLEYQLTRSGCKLDTERCGCPHTLVVTKTAEKFNQDHHMWKERCGDVRKSFKSIGVEPLKEMLGEDYQRTYDLWPVRIDPARAATLKAAAGTMHRPPTPPPPLNRNQHLARAWRGNSTAVKRKPLETVTQPHARATAGLSDQSTKVVRKTEIIDLTAE
ncbi:MAG: hypothetical protein Q9168_007428 [Polycauliona sp. 1 TL-2023]